MFSKQNGILFFCIVFLFLLIYFQVFFADYAYLDEIYLLWHNDDNTNFRISHTQGRWLSGLIFQKLFTSISTIKQLKLLRLFSLAGWIATTFLWSAIFKKWVNLLGFNNRLWWIGTLYVVCGISTAIYIGWTILGVFLSVSAALLSGHILFKNLYQQKKEIRIPTSVLFGSLILSIISLFIYQPTFGIFLLPFFLHYLQRKKTKPDRIIIIGVIFYLIGYIAYYFLFKYSLQAYHMEASTRTAIHFQFLKKLSFFFAGPLPQAFSLNLLFSASSIFSQVFYPLIIIVWVITVFQRNRENKTGGNLVFIAFVFLLLALIYLPNMVSAENFPSYRSSFVFNLAVFIMVIEGLFHFFSTEKKQKIFSWIVSIWLIISGFYAFNFQYIIPLKKEYAILKNFMQKNYKPGIGEVHFIRADKFMFSAKYHTRVYRDEFGAPSTYRDWVPEPITKQMIYEITGDRKLAEGIKVVQYENEEAFYQLNPVPDSHTLLIDMNKLFADSVNKKEN